MVIQNYRELYYNHAVQIIFATGIKTIILPTLNFYKDINLQVPISLIDFMQLFQLGFNILILMFSCRNIVEIL